MFGSDNGQAEGLKDWFRPGPAGRIDVLSVHADATAVSLASHIARTVGEYSLKIDWEDPLGLLTDAEQGKRPARTADIIVGMNRDRFPAAVSIDKRLGILFTATPRPEFLPGLYTAIKSVASMGLKPPVAIVWTGTDAQRVLCEENLTRTCQRFLEFSPEFLCGPQAWRDASRLLDRNNHVVPYFLQPLADLVRSRFGSLTRPMPVVHN